MNDERSSLKSSAIVGGFANNAGDASPDSSEIEILKVVKAPEKPKLPTKKRRIAQKPVDASSDRDLIDHPPKLSKMTDLLFELEIEHIDPPPRVVEHSSREVTAKSLVDMLDASNASTSTIKRPTPKASEVQAATKKPTSAKSATKKETINTWPGIEEVAKNSGVSSVTCVDPGTRNLALMRMEFYPVVRITHARVIDLDVLCKGLEECDPKLRLRNNRTDDAPDYPMEAYLYALRRYVETEARAGSGGCFDSDMCLVEEQSFDRLMSRVEATIVTTFEVVRGSPIVVLEGAEGGTVAAGQLINAKSVKACYRPLFPLIADEIIPTESTQASRRKAFGVGDVRGGTGDKQRLLHKKMAIKYGSMLIPQDRFAKVVPVANFTEYDKQRLAQRKMDDLYDTLFMCCYFVSTFMFHFYKCRKRGFASPLPAFKTPPQRPHAAYEEIVEVAFAVGTERDALQGLLDALLGNESIQI